MYLDYAEDQARRRKLLYMRDLRWNNTNNFMPAALPPKRRRTSALLKRS